MTVVSNSSPLISLARVRRLDLLQALFGMLSIPKAVHEEIVVAGRGLPGAAEVSAAGWIRIMEPVGNVDHALSQACAGLGAGEVSAIIAAKLVTADLLLLDEWKARRVARDAGLSVLGCLGALEIGFRKGLVADLRGVYADLLREGIRFDIRLLQDSLQRLGQPLL